ncbi:MAG TPA: PASTA domain-containing protein, partial [Acidimicrobiia bacterium]|nr:PASTA domain-containing protein [Acidimicrobiia bacterium]
AGTVDPMATSSLTDLAGRVLAERYRLRAPIGAGASGQVYLADDSRLRRRVAVKVLHAALADDVGFLRRFRSEAQVAASLHHPNIVAVYDWGEDGVPFMVLELLEGGSLRSMLDRSVRLTPAQATHVGRQVCSALEYAHTRGLVHRDIKPANLLFDEHGIVRVADFGLARALAEASWTEPAGTVLGTARYSSPEQARGTALDGRSDLYALALVLMESVTGTVPNVSDTAIGTLAARTQNSIVAPDELGGLGRVVERAGRVDPDERYPDAATMGTALADAALGLPPPSPLALAGFGEMNIDPDPTEVRGASKGALFDQDAVTVIDEPDVSVGPRIVARRRTVRLTAGVVVFAVALLAIGAAIYALSSAGTSTDAVPGLVGRGQNDAAALIARRGLVVKVVTLQADDPKGVVIGQSPAPGSWLHDGGAVHLAISSGPAPVPVPVTSGMAAADAQKNLEQLGFAVTIERKNDETVPKNNAISTDPAVGTALSRDAGVKLVVSDGPAPVPVPDVSAKLFDDASKVLTAAKFTVQRADDFSDSIDKGKVIKTEPAANQSGARGSQVIVHVSKGPELVTVPDFTGLTVEAASQKIQSLGLPVPDVSGYAPGKPVVAQSPKAGSQIPKSTQIRLFL